MIKDPKDMTPFETWWYNEGSGMGPCKEEEHDLETFAKRIAKIAWENGEYVASERCQKEYAAAMSPGKTEAVLEASKKYLRELDTD